MLASVNGMAKLLSQWQNRDEGIGLVGLVDGVESGLVQGLIEASRNRGGGKGIRVNGQESGLGSMSIGALSKRHFPVLH